MKTNSKKTPSISIIIPVYNEEDNVEILYNEIRESIEPLKIYYEVVFIDDGSVDETFNILTKIKMKNQQEVDGLASLRIIKLSRNFGQSAAMQAGFDHANGEIIVSLDGDLQNDPRDIPRLLNMLEEGYELVCGWRKDRKDKTLTRIIPSKIANWLIAKITGVPIHDNGCSLKAYRGSMIRKVRLYSDMHRFIPAITTLEGSRITEIVVNHRAREHGISKYGISRIWKVLFDIITIKMLIHFHYRPILWFSLLASIFFVLGLGLGILTILHILHGDRSIVYPASSFLCFYLFGSLVTWGFLAEFFIRIEKSKL